ncbi:MAG: glycoside hydrolase family 2 TIM barrel-domain containing protein [Lentisphaeria bacterium]
MLNGHPLHLFSDWGHKTTPYYLTEGWTRQWFRMLRDANMNHSRLHTHPHPPFILDLADEEGILITGETGLHGSGQAIASDSPVLWDTARDHLRRFVRRDKNHPCLVLWSVENEMRWNGNQTALTMEKLPELRRYFNELDPTRTAYHEGDTSLWNEAEQPLLSRHYYKACSGAGWWDRRQPLHAGEMALYHYAGPNNTSHLAGDRAWSSFKAIDVAAAQDAAWIIETGRSLGVVCFGPWNLSCLENLRRERELVELKYDDFTTPGMKPLRVPAHSSEFSFWRRGKGYTPNHSFAIQAAAFRPFAVIDRSRRSGQVAGTPFRRELFLVNDTPAEIRGGTLTVTLTPAGRRGTASGPVAQAVHPVAAIARGRVAAVALALELPAGLKPGRHLYSCEFRNAAGTVLDRWSRGLTVGPAFAALAAAHRPLTGRVAVFGPGTLAATLAAAGLAAVAVPDLKAETLAGFRFLVLEPNTIRAGTVMNQELAAFARRGGRALLLEQQVSPFFGLPVTEKPLQTQFVRDPGHPVLRGLKDADFAFWGDTPFPQLGGDACVTLRPFGKDDALHTRVLLDGDEGGFGDGGLRYTSLVELEEGGGLVLACQLRLLEHLDSIPAAARLFYNLLRRLAGYRPPSAVPPVLVDGAAAESAGEAARLAAEARAGATIVVRQATAELLAAFGRELGVELRPDPRPLPVYQAVRVRDAEPLLAGVSNEDTCGMDMFTYSPPQHFANHPVCEIPLAAAPGLEPLLATPTDSVLKEFHVFGGGSEPLRAHTQSRFLFEEKAVAAVVLGRVRAGRGQVLFNQFAPPKELKPRYPRLDHRLLANLGMRFPGSPLDGPGVPCGGCTGPGFPERLHVLNPVATPELVKNLVDATRYSVEHLGVAFPILAVPGWVKTETPDGVVSAAGLDLGRDVFLYSPVVSPVSRKELSSNLGVPNPDALTFLDLEGEGEVTVTLNAATRRPQALTGGRATVPDLPLEQGGNHVLIRWRPLGPASTLRLRWRNLNGRPETGFRFP